MNRTERLLAQALPALLVLLFAGCGGGADEVLSLRAQTPVVAAAAPAANPPAANPPAANPPAALGVRIEGCVVDDYFIPRSDAPVRALGADGRLLANAQSNVRGEFKLQVPQGQIISLGIDRPGGDVIKVATGQRSRALTTCLLDPSA